MRKFAKYLAAGAMLAMILPGIASAHNGEGNKDNSDKVRSGLHVFEDLKGNDDSRNHFRVVDVDNILKAHINGETRFGTVTAVGSNSFTLQADNGTAYTVNTAGASISLPFQGKAVFSDIKVNDQAKVQGTISGSVVTAASIVLLPANKRPAKASGTVTAVSGSTLTVQTKGNNSITVNTNGNTSVTKADGSVGATSDVQVGSSVKIKGLWNMMLSVLDAIKIHLK